MAQRGGISKINYRETRGLKVASGQPVKQSTLLTRQGSKWRAGVNVLGKGGSLVAACEGEVYFTKKKGSYKRKKVYTFINIKPVSKKKK
jgi:ribosomal protein L27